MHIVPCKLFCDALGAPDMFKENESGTVNVPVRTLRLMVEALLETQEIDDTAYRRANPDVAAAVRAGRLPSAEEHFRKSGWFEGRKGADCGFDEAWYVGRYADVRQAVAAGKYPTGWAHYQAEGMLEWRSPNATAEQDLHRWREALAGADKGAMSGATMRRRTA